MIEQTYQTWRQRRGARLSLDNRGQHPPQLHKSILISITISTMPPQIKQDLNRSGWETTDFPSVCENVSTGLFPRLKHEALAHSHHDSKLTPHSASQITPSSKCLSKITRKNASSVRAPSPTSPGKQTAPRARNPRASA